MASRKPKRNAKTHNGRARERRLLDERTKHAATGPDQDKNLWQQEIQRRRDESFTVASTSAPNRTWGPTDFGHEEQPPPLWSDPEVMETLDRLENNPESIDPEVMRRVHEKLMNRRAEINDQLDGTDAEVEALYRQVVDDLQMLVDNGQLDADRILPENIGRTISYLSSLRLGYGEIANRSDLRELLAAIEAEYDFCDRCDKLYPTGSHVHGEETKILPPTQRMNGERVCDSAELVTLNQLANFSAFEKTIPFSVIRKLDPTGTHLIGFRSHGDETRGVKSRDYFRCQMLVKLRGREKPWYGMLDIVPAWFIRLDEADLDMREGTPQSVKMDLAPDAFPREWEGRGGLSHLVAERTDTKPYQEIPVHVISDEQMTKEVQESDRSLLENVAHRRGLADYRALGKFEAWAQLATNPDPKIVQARFDIALRAVRRAGDRQFTEMHVDEAIMEWREDQERRF